MGSPLGVALLGTGFMGRAHSHAWRTAPTIFDLARRPVLRTVVGRDPAKTAAFAERWGWERSSTDWAEVVADPAVDLVDIATPNRAHPEQAIAALEAGKAVACEKPLAATLADARAMRDAAARTGRPTFMWYSYRRVPAVALAHRLVAEGRVGPIRHVRAAYLQSWGGPTTPMAWRFRAEEAGTGALGDLGSHIVDLARFVTGEEIVEVSGASAVRFVEERPAGSASEGSTVDDAVAFLARLTGGALATFEASRVATGMKNANRFEIHGERGALRFDFERMNELGFLDATLPGPLQGWQTLYATHPEHPWAGSWWPDGHGLGYDHTFVNGAADIVTALNGGGPVVPLPDFADAYETERVLAAVAVSARERRPVPLAEIP